MINYCVIGGGWRSEFYLRIAKCLPEIFAVKGICVRNPKRAKEISEKYGINTVDSIDDILKIDCDFFVNCINKDDISKLSFELCNLGYAVLQETPADSVLKEKSSYKLQVAEQFHLKPMYQAIKGIINDGIIGEVNHIEISVAHEYHAMSLIRFFTGVDMPQCVYSTELNTAVLHTHFRQGELAEKEIADSKHQIAVFDCNGKSAIYNFDYEQYFSPIRSDRLLIRGTRGEIENNAVRYFNDKNQYVEGLINQHKSGNLDGFFNGTITFCGKVYYESPFADARLSDEETAIATGLLKMDKYMKTGEEFYSYESAVKDVVCGDCSCLWRRNGLE